METTSYFSSPGRTVVLLLASTLILALRAMAQHSSESLLTTDNAYNPIPSPDGSYLAYVHTGWGERWDVSTGRSSLVSDVKVMDLQGAAAPRTLAKEYFLSGWTPDSTQLVCYRDWKYALVSMDGKRMMEGAFQPIRTSTQRRNGWHILHPSRRLCGADSSTMLLEQLKRPAVRS